MSVQNIGASIRNRLLNKARAEKLDFNLLLTRYALERMLYRLSISAQHDQFLLKGALLFDLWFDGPHRPTHDADLLGQIERINYFVSVADYWDSGFRKKQ